MDSEVTPEPQPATQKGFDMILSLAVKEWEAQSAAFDTVDSKSSSTIGFVSLATGIVGAMIVQDRQPRDVTAIACIGIALLGIGVWYALRALRTRSVEGLPEIPGTVAYFEYYGDSETTKTLIDTVEGARATLKQATDKKADLLDEAHNFVIGGLAVVLAAVLFKGLAF